MNDGYLGEMVYLILKNVGIVGPVPIYSDGAHCRADDDGADDSDEDRDERVRNIVNYGSMHPKMVWRSKAVNNVSSVSDVVNVASVSDSENDNINVNGDSFVAKCKKQKVRFSFFTRLFFLHFVKKTPLFFTFV